jgi:hypothetical protein
LIKVIGAGAFAVKIIFHKTIIFYFLKELAVDRTSFVPFDITKNTDFIPIKKIGIGSKG